MICLDYTKNGVILALIHSIEPTLAFFIERHILGHKFEIFDTAFGDDQLNILDVASRGITCELADLRDIVIKDGAYYSTASLPVDTVHNQSFEKDSIYLIVPRDVQIAYPDYNNRAQLIIWQSGRPIYALPITQYDSLSYVRMLQGDTLRTIFSQQAGSLPIYGKRPIV